MKSFLEKVRTPELNIPRQREPAITIGLVLAGFALGLLQKWLDSTPTNAFSLLMQQLDIHNYFGRLAIWILLAAVISVYAKSPLLAAIHTFAFLISMVGGYYLYCNFVLGFLPRAYMMVWIVLSFVSTLPAYICWYAKGKGLTAILISALILGALMAQAVSLTQEFYVYHVTEVITWLLGVIILYRKPKEFAMEILFSVVIAILYQLLIPHFG